MRVAVDGVRDQPLEIDAPRELLAHPDQLPLELVAAVLGQHAGTTEVCAHLVGVVCEASEGRQKMLGEMGEEQRRAGREELTEEELAIFDLVTKPEPKLTKAQEIHVRKIARDLLRKLKGHELVFKWRERQETRVAVQSTIRVELNELPEEPYPEELWNEKVEASWQFVFTHYPDAPSNGAFVR